MTEVDLNNKEIIKRMVKENWSLKKESLDLFNERIEVLETNSFYADLIKSHGSEDNRIRFKLPGSELERFDEG